MRFLILFLLLVLSAPAQAGQVVKGPVLADVVRVVDGDTLDVGYRLGEQQKEIGLAIWVYKHLEKFAGPRVAKNSHPKGTTKYADIASELGVSKRTARNHIGILREHGYIKTRQVQHGFEFEILKSVDMVLHKRIRIDGVDTPELKGKCASEKQAAIAARAFVKSALEGKQVYLLDVRNGKFAGRQVARVVIVGTGIDLAELLIEKGHGRPYSGGKRRGWCAGEPPGVKTK